MNLGCHSSLPPRRVRALGASAHALRSRAFAPTDVHVTRCWPGITQFSGPLEESMHALRAALEQGGLLVVRPLGFGMCPEHRVTAKRHGGGRWLRNVPRRLQALEDSVSDEDGSDINGHSTI